MIAHDVADTGHLITAASVLTKTQWAEAISPGQVVLDWDGEENSVGAVLDALVWTKEVWLASIEGRDQPVRPPLRTAAQLAAEQNEEPQIYLSKIMRKTSEVTLSRELRMRYDKDRDGRLTPEELGWTPERIAPLDANRDGVLSTRELTNFDDLPVDGHRSAVDVAAFDALAGSIRCDETR